MIQTVFLSDVLKLGQLGLALALKCRLLKSVAALHNQMMNQAGTLWHQFPKDYHAIVSSDAANLELMQAVMEHGVVIVDNMPQSDDSSVLLDFVNNYLGGMQKARTYMIAVIIYSCYSFIMI